MKHYYSFDIFDTCFVRACGSPHNVFDLLAYRILGEESEESLRMDFAAIRIEGERKARLYSGKKEVNLTDIYECCSFEGLTSMDKRQIAAAEMEIEREQLVPVYSILQKIKELHKISESVYYISDMYLPQEFIHELLVKHGFWQSGDKLYVSCVSGNTKQDGSLFKQVAEENAIVYRHWYHWGDNRRSDYRVPKRMGIKATLVHHKSSIYEQFLQNQDCLSGFFVNQHLAGISKAVRLSFPMTPQYAFAANLIAPLYVAFVYRILQDAVRRNIEKLFFLARDGYILYQIAKDLEVEFPDIEIKYLYVSRSSLYLPGLPKITPETLSSLRRTAFGFTNEKSYDILKNFVTPEILKKIEQITPQNACEDLFNDPNVLNVLTSYYEEQRNLVLKYFVQEGLADHSHKTAIVDVRGTRSCQQAINCILQQGNYNQVIGYYLEVINNRKSINNAGSYHALYYGERILSSHYLKYISSELGSILEQYFSLSPHKRTIAYCEINGVVQPVFEKNENGTYVQDLVKCHEKVMSLFICLFKNNKLPLHIPIVLMLSTNLLAYFSHRPVYYYLKALHQIKVNNKKNNYVYIVKSLFPLNIKRNSTSWTRGSIYFTIKTTFGYNVINCIFPIVKKVMKKLIKKMR